MLILFLLSIISYIGTSKAVRTFEESRVSFLPSDASYTNKRPLTRRSLPEAFNIRTNDYDDSSNQFLDPRSPLHFHESRVLEATTKTPLKIHPPREDPRIFYDALYNENIGKNFNNKITSYNIIGRGPTITYEKIHKPLRHLRVRDKRITLMSEENTCIRCPNDRTLVAKPGLDKVMLLTPRLYTCSGIKAPRDVRFIQMYGPKFGTLVSKGSYTIIGRISYRGKSHHLCTMQIHIVTHMCTTPPYLAVDCDTHNHITPCNFTCKDEKAILHGQKSLVCDSNMNWNGELPVCRKPTADLQTQAQFTPKKLRKWCSQPKAPQNGRLSCKGQMLGVGLGFMEGAVCRVRCARGYRWIHAAAMCHRGTWTNTLMCSPKSSILRQ